MQIQHTARFKCTKCGAGQKATFRVKNVMHTARLESALVKAARGLGLGGDVARAIFRAAVALLSA